MAAVRVPPAGFAPKAFGNTLPCQGNRVRLDANRRVPAKQPAESNGCSDLVRRFDRDRISFKQIVLNARYRRHPLRSKVRAYRMKMNSALALAVVALFMTSPARSQSDPRSQQQLACEDDAYRLCADEIPDEARVSSCMARQKSKLSPGCRAMFAPSPRHRARH